MNSVLEQMCLREFISLMIEAEGPFHNYSALLTSNSSQSSTGSTEDWVTKCFLSYLFPILPSHKAKGLNKLSTDTLKKVNFDDRSPWLLAYNSEGTQTIPILTKLFPFPFIYVNKVPYHENKIQIEWTLNSVLLQQ